MAHDLIPALAQRTGREWNAALLTDVSRNGSLHELAAAEKGHDENEYEYRGEHRRDELRQRDPRRNCRIGAPEARHLGESVVRPTVNRAVADDAKESGDKDVCPFDKVHTYDSNPFSTCHAAFNIFSSPHIGPISCRPTGRPDCAPTPAGTEIAGTPARFTGTV